MNDESALTPLLLKAAQIYTKTYGLFPPVFIDMLIKNNEIVCLKISSFKKNKLNFAWSWAVLLFIICMWLSNFAALLKTFLSPSITIFQMVMLIFFLNYSTICLTSLAIFVRNKHVIDEVNKFLRQGFNFGKN